MHFSSQLLFRTFQCSLLFLVLSFQGVAQAPPSAWANQAGGIGYEEGYGIAVDGSGNSYVTGYFEGTATFGSTTLTSSGSVDVFIAKYDASGNVLWAKKAGGTDHDQSNSIAADGSGYCYVSGTFSGAATFGSTTLISSIGGADVFIAKYDASGNVLWAKKTGGIGVKNGNGIAVDGSGNSYVTGSFNGSATFDNTTLTNSGNDDVFIAKYDASGNVLWAQKAGGTSYDNGISIDVDGSGNSYVTGTFYGTAIFGSTTLTTSGSVDVFIAKYDASGNVFWAKKAGGTGIDEGWGIAVDSSGNSYVTGTFNGMASFGSTTLTSSGSNDVFIAKYDASGSVLWVQKAGGTGDDISYGIAVGGSGNCYMTGYFEGTATFGSTTLTSSGSKDVFIAKLSSTVTGLPSELSAALPTYPNPFSSSFQLSLPGSVPATVVLTDVLGREVHRQAVTPPTAKSTVTISPAVQLPSGVYGLQIRQDGSVKQLKVVKQ